MATKILEIDRPTNKGISYPRAIVEKAIAAHVATIGMNKMGIFKSIEITRENLIGYADNLRIEDGYLVGDIFLVDKWVQEMAIANKRNFCIRPIGRGVVNPETGEVEEGYAFHALTIRFPPAVPVDYEKN